MVFKVGWFWPVSIGEMKFRCTPASSPVAPETVLPSVELGAAPGRKAAHASPRIILERKQINVVRGMLEHWCTCVMRSKVEPMKEIVALVRRHLEGIVAWAQTRQTNGFLEALNGLFQAAKRRARAFSRLSTVKTVLFLIVGKLDFHTINPHARQPT